MRKTIASLSYLLSTVVDPKMEEEKIDPKIVEVRDEGKELRTEPIDSLESFPLSKEEKEKVST